MLLSKTRNGLEAKCLCGFDPAMPGKNAIVRIYDNGVGKAKLLNAV